MYKLFLFISLIMLPTFSSNSENNTLSKSNSESNNNSMESECHTLYNEMHIDNTVNYKAFREAYEGFKKIKGVKKNVLTLIDFTKPSTENRLFVIDLQAKKVLFSSLVSHGKKSGEKFATSFSNQNNSHKSSLGFYITENTYKGKNGYSLILNGLEKGINDHAKARSIVVHGASYSNPSVIKSGRLGRSFGCPAIPEALSEPIIDAIKDGSVLFIYADNETYRKQSPILKM